MSLVDRERIAGVKALRALGYCFDGVEWNAAVDAPMPATLRDEADAMHSLLVLRADKLVGFTEGSEEEAEYAMIAETIEAYEAVRWPDGVETKG